MSTRLRGARIVLLVCAALLLGGVVVHVVGDRSEAPAPVAADRTADATPTPTPSDRAAAPADDGAAVPAPSAAAASVPAGQKPVRLTIPAIGVDSPLTDLGIAADGSIEVPSVPAHAGWLDTGPAPGQVGPAVIAGHVDSRTGPAVFYQLRELSPGDAVVVTRRDGTRVRFTVDGVRTYEKSHFPTQATYGPVPGPALRLITCGGAYDRSHGGYQSNVVVFAT